MIPPGPFDDVRETSDRLGLQVRSRSKPDEWHGVTFRINDGHGFCDCPHFIWRIDGKLLSTRKVPLHDPRAFCWHIRRAREFLASRTIAEELAKKRSAA